MSGLKRVGGRPDFGGACQSAAEFIPNQRQGIKFAEVTRCLTYALMCMLLSGPVLAWDRDLDNDGRWDYDRGGTDRDVDNDGRWDHDKGGSDRDLDNDGRWDFDAGGSDRDIDNDGRWDYDKGGSDRDLDNDNRWDGSIQSSQHLHVAATDFASGISRQALRR